MSVISENERYRELINEGDFSTLLYILENKRKRKSTIERHNTRLKKHLWALIHS